MSLSSISYLSESAVKSFLRFPLVLLSSLFVFIFSTFSIYTQPNDSLEVIINSIIMTLALGVPLFFVIRIWSETQKNFIISYLTANLLGIALLLGIFWFLPHEKSTFNTDFAFVQYAIFSISIHLLVSVAPVLNKRIEQSFWEYNKMLFLRLWLALFFSLVIYLGLILAIVVFSRLFDFKVNGEFYGSFYIFNLAFVNIWIFISGIETNLDKLNFEKEYPKGLKIFTQFILIPLLSIYLLIIYGYGFKILFTQEWPEGIVSYLIIGISVLGYLTNLLLHPIAKQNFNNWINLFSKVYYYLMIPLAVFLFFAIGIRLNDYGFTINRYYILLLGVWILFTSLYQILRAKNIKIIPISLAIFCVLSTFGFWSAYNVSEKSQVNRLNKILTESGFLKNKNLISEFNIKDNSPLTDNFQPKISNENAKEVKSILKYLDKFHRFEKIQPWFRQNLDSLSFKIDSNNINNWNDEPDYILKIMGISKDTYNTIEAEEEIVHQRYFNSIEEPTITNGYDLLVGLELRDSNPFNYSSTKSFSYNNTDYSIGFTESNFDLYIHEKSSEITDSIYISSFINRITKQYKTSNYKMPKKALTYYAETKNYSVKAILNKVKIEYEFDTPTTEDIELELLIHFKDN